MTFPFDIATSYELQVSGLFRSSGIGHFLVEKLTAIGKRWGMSKIMLTALKSMSSYFLRTPSLFTELGNVAAGRFYSKTGLVCLIYLPLGLTECLYRFEVDPSSPDYGPTSEDDDSPDEDAEDEPCDYEILSKTLE